MSRQSRKPQAETESTRTQDAQANRAQDDTQDRVRTDDALSAARRAGLDARVVVRPTIVLGPPPRGPSHFKLDGSTLRGVLVPDAPEPVPRTPGDPEAFGLVTLPPSLVDELVTGPLPEPAEPQGSNYRGDDCQTVRLSPEAAAQLELRPAVTPAWDGTLSQARTIERVAPISEDADTWVLPSAQEAMQRPLPPPPPPAATRSVAVPPARLSLGRTWRSPTIPPAELPQPRPRYLPLWVWLLVGLALITMLLAYALTYSLLTHEAAPRIEPLSHADSSAAAVSGTPAR